MTNLSLFTDFLGKCVGVVFCIYLAVILACMVLLPVATALYLLLK